ncbi:TniQ family protein [Roseinatronobacter sp.]|uniref:TniQ family protein n=1 Tax=Roseinatronobacter sp. TaxID=1945755 RepID=UPI003F70634B
MLGHKIFNLNACLELLSWTGTRAGNVRMQFRGELYVSRALRNPAMRGCPVCLREDAAGASGPPYGAMAMRGDWQLREVTVCTRHGHPLVPLWQAAAPRDRFDIGARLREIEADIMSGALDRPARAPSAYDLWLDRRLEDGRDDTWLRDHPVFVVTTLCRLLGQAVLREDSPGEEYASGRIHAAGFEIVVDGAAEIMAALDRIATISTGAWDEPQKAFGPLYTKLNRDYLHESGFDPFRNILRDCILDNWPLGPGDVVLGEAVRERLLHSLLTAKKETGIGTTVLEHFLTEAGAIRPNDPRPLGRRLFDAQAHAGLLAEIPTLVGPIAMRKAMGATKMELIALTEEGLLFPRTQVEKVKKPWRILDGMALVNELSARSVPVSGDDRNWTTLLLARKQTGVSLVELVEAVRNARLKVGRRVGVVGFHGIVVRLAEVDRMATPRTLLDGAKADDVPAGNFERNVPSAGGRTINSYSRLSLKKVSLRA